MNSRMSGRDDLLNVCNRFKPDLEELRRYALDAAIHDKVFSSEYLMSRLTQGLGGLRSFYDISNEELKTLYSRIKKKVIGQDHAVRKLVDAINKSKMLPCARKKPIGSFCFMGPTGTGKTYLAEVLAEELLGNDLALIPIDLTLFKHQGDVSRLFGAPPGYIGYRDEGGRLNELITERKCGVLRFDEFEKAHPEILDSLMEIMDKGKSTESSSGQEITFYEFVLIFTSNLGVSKASQCSVPEERQDIYINSLKAAYKPEIVNRFDEIVIFEPFNREDAAKITGLLLQKRLQDVQTHHSVTITYDQAIIDHLVDIGFDPEYNARPLERTIERCLMNPLSGYLLNEKITQGDNIHIYWRDDRFVLKKSAATSREETNETA
ncbi:MAG TPA: ATP-dependent Clp protease ATP-binding subunit [bacterium]|nr:ATP-dependent Clp protease ATP-binding subunit [bacterium]